MNKLRFTINVPLYIIRGVYIVKLNLLSYGTCLGSLLNEIFFKFNNFVFSFDGPILGQIFATTVCGKRALILKVPEN